MPDTIPDTKWISDVAADALDGTLDSASGLAYISEGTHKGSSPTYRVQLNRIQKRLATIVATMNQLRLAEENAALKVGVYAGDYTLGGTHKHFAGATAQAVTDNATKVWYLDAANALTEAASYPADITTFVPLATVVAASGVITSIVDDRGHAEIVVPTATTSSDTGTNEVSFVLDADNAGAGADTSLVGNRGTTAADWRLLWDETLDYFHLQSELSGPTLALLNLLGIKIGGTTMLDTNGAAKVAAAVAGAGLDHAAGVLSVPVASANGTSIDGGGNLIIDPSDGIALDANGVRVSLTADSGLTLTGAAGSKTLGVDPDDTTIENDAGGVRRKDGGANGTHFADITANGTGAIILMATLTAGNTVTIWNVNAPFKARVIDAWSAAKGTDAGTWYVDNGTDAITNTVTVAAGDKTVARAGTIDDAKCVILASGSLRVVGDGALCDVDVYVTVINVA